MYNAFEYIILIVQVIIPKQNKNFKFIFKIHIQTYWTINNFFFHTVMTVKLINISSKTTRPSQHSHPT